MDVLLAHLRENDLRSGLTFLDKALAVSEAGVCLRRSRAEDITQTQLAAVARERGLCTGSGADLTDGLHGRPLLPLIPTALKGGMGRPQVERIRQLGGRRKAYLASAFDGFRRRLRTDLCGALSPVRRSGMGHQQPAARAGGRDRGAGGCQHPRHQYRAR